MARKKDIKEEKIEVVEIKETKDKSKRKSIFVYFLMMIGIFALINVVLAFLTSDLYDIVFYDKYGADIISEIFYGLLVLIVMLLFKNAYVFTNKKERLLKSLAMASPVILLSVFILVSNILDLSTHNPQAITTSNIFSVIVLCILVGITEEFLCRGWLQNEFLERYGDTKKNVITSIVFSSFIFGIMHLTNVSATSQNLFETLLQVLNAMSLGFLLGIIYYRTKNIWSVIILHAFYDFSIMVGELAVIKDCTYGVATPQIVAISSFSILVLSAFWILSSLIILKRCNFPDEKVDYSRTKLRDFYLIVLPLLVFTFILSVIPFENMIEGYNDYYVCYSYDEIELKENYAVHRFVYDKFKINYEGTKTSYVIDEDKVNEVLNVGKYDFEVFLKDGMAVLRNVNTGVETKLHNDNTYGLVVIEGEDNYFIAIVTQDASQNENVYVSDYMSKENLSNSDDYLQAVAESMRKIDLPTITTLGYITIEGKDEKIPMFYSDNRGLFIIKDDELYLVK